MIEKNEKHNFTEHRDILRVVNKKHSRHMQTKGRRVRNINPFSEVEKDIRLIHKEAKVNPWYVYRNYLSEQGQLQLYKEDYSSVYCIFNNVNTWVNNKNHDVPYDYTNIIKALISLSLTKKSKSTVIYVKDLNTVRIVESMIVDEVSKLPLTLRKEYMSYNRLSVISSYPAKATWMASMYENIVILDFYQHMEIDRFISLFHKQENKTFLITTNELGNHIRYKDVKSLEFKNYVCTKWSNYAYELRGRVIKRLIGGHFILHDYNY